MNIDIWVIILLGVILFVVGFIIGYIICSLKYKRQELEYIPPIEEYEPPRMMYYRPPPVVRSRPRETPVEEKEKEEEDLTGDLPGTWVCKICGNRKATLIHRLGCNECYKGRQYNVK